MGDASTKGSASTLQRSTAEYQNEAPTTQSDCSIAQWIEIDRVKVSKHHRAIKPWSLQQIKQSMAQHGYNVAYPIVIDPSGELVDGLHRLEAARSISVERIPYIVKPSGISNIRFGLQCNADGQLCQAEDVFDYAELCYGLAQEGWTGERIAEEVGWADTATVTRHANIKAKLHLAAWQLARYELTKKDKPVNQDNEGLVNDELTKVNWSESHFRAFLKHLPYAQGDRPVMRAQVKAINEITDGKVTAKRIEQLAIRYGWYVELEKYMRDHLVTEVPLRDRVNLLKSIRKNVFGAEPTDKNREKLAGAIAAINERILGVRLYHDDALERVPLLADKSVALVVNDPPYNVTEHEWDRIGTRDEFLAWTRNWLAAIRPKLKDDYHLFLFCSPHYQADIEALLVGDDWPLRSRIIWSHRNLSMGRDVADKFIDMYEMVFHCGTHPLNWPPEWNEERFAVQEHAAPQSNFKNDKKEHATAKPLGLVELFVRVGSKPGDVIVDMFAGGGTTGQACVKVGQRRCTLIEKNGEFCEVIERRLGVKRVTEVINA